jgi:hypothetical protein
MDATQAAAIQPGRLRRVGASAFRQRPFFWTDHDGDVQYVHDAP